MSMHQSYESLVSGCPSNGWDRAAGPASSRCGRVRRNAGIDHLGQRSSMATWCLETAPQLQSILYIYTSSKAVEARVTASEGESSESRCRFRILRANAHNAKRVAESRAFLPNGWRPVESRLAAFGEVRHHSCELMLFCQESDSRVGVGRTLNLAWPPTY